jgi:nucleotide-binding universal stress UspA family protein
MAYKVMVPLDGSRLAENSLVYLDALKSLGESEVLLVSVVDESEGFRGLHDAESRAREANLLSTYLREVSADVERHLGIGVATKVLAGSPAAAILDEAMAYAPDLIVVSTSGRSGISRWRVGSVADKLVRGATCDTLAVGPKAAGRSTWIDARIIEPFKTLLLPLDGSPLAENALPVAAAFADAYGSILHLVRVVPIPTVNGFSGEAYVPDMLDALVGSAHVYLKDTAASLKRPAVTTEVIVGSAAPRLEDYVAANAIDLVVMTSHGRSGFIRTALGSITDRLLGGAAPVLVVRPRE